MWEWKDNRKGEAPIGKSSEWNKIMVSTFKEYLQESGGLKVYLDDERSVPSGWHLCKDVDSVISLLKTGKVSELSLDHDLGMEHSTGDYSLAPNGYDVLLWIEKEVHLHGFNPPKIKIHTANSTARRKMELAVKAIEKYIDNRHI